MHSWECVSCFVWEDLDESECRKVWSSEIKHPQCRAQDLFVKKMYCQDNKHSFLGVSFGIILNESQETEKNLQIYLLNVQFSPLIRPLQNKTAWKVTDSLVK